VGAMYTSINPKPYVAGGYAVLRGTIMQRNNADDGASKRWWNELVISASTAFRDSTGIGA
jgi:hypothetical protein